MQKDKIYLAPECLGANIELVGISADMYKDGVRQSEPVGWSYEVILREHKSDKLKIRIPGPKQMDEPASGYSIPVLIDEIRVRPYLNRSTGMLAFSATATGIRPAEKHSKA